VKIPFGKKARAVYFLHGCGWIPKLGRTGKYEFVYGDGTSGKVKIVADAPSPQQNIKANICDSAPFFGQIETEDARKVIVMSPKGTLYIYTLQWLNPKPGKTIAKIILRSHPEATSGSLLVFGITAVTE
jgi:hypothetical protein